MYRLVIQAESLYVSDPNNIHLCEVRTKKVYSL